MSLELNPDFFWLMDNWFCLCRQNIFLYGTGIGLSDYQPGIDGFLKSAAKVRKTSVRRKEPMPENAYFNKYLISFADFYLILSRL